MGMTITEVQARALELKLDVIIALDRMITSAELRLSAIFREIDRHRERKQFAKALRAPLSKVADGEFEAITTAPQLQSSNE